MPPVVNESFDRRVTTLRRRIGSLSTIREVVGLPRSVDLSEAEWGVVRRPLEQLQATLLYRLDSLVGRSQRSLDPKQARSLRDALGRLDLRVANAFTLYDTYMDILTQRHSPELGPLLRGCDAIARDALVRPHPALQLNETPLVYCDRGFGASVLRTGARIFEEIANPAPLIQLPYERLKEKLHLTSLVHEAGHEALSRTGVAKVLVEAMRDGLSRAGAPQAVSSFYAHWSSELGPDFWGFLACGPAQAATAREVLALPAAHAFRLSMLEPHPPPFLRCLCAFDWCRQVWGRGPWDRWEEEWLDSYPIVEAPPSTQEIFTAARLAVPTVGRILLTTRFHALGGRSLPSLWNLDALSSASMEQPARVLANRRQMPSAIPPTAALAVFRFARERRMLSDDDVDRAIGNWLRGLAARRENNIVPLRKKVG